MVWDDCMAIIGFGLQNVCLKYTERPTDILTTSDPILQFLKPHIKKLKKKLCKNLSDGTLKLSKIKLEVFLN